MTNHVTAGDGINGYRVGSRQTRCRQEQKRQCNCRQRERSIPICHEPLPVGAPAPCLSICSSKLILASLR
ncbi:hypothetical protein, partial [Candidatus Binatus sp.]|uniref:hypothetical protein n=1 Tax=Candidatus Binatus sp. TaxID=2811406 RepID=UPI003C3C5FC4